jgi:hypothetical protein
MDGDPRHLCRLGRVACIKRSFGLMAERRRVRELPRSRARAQERRSGVQRQRQRQGEERDAVQVSTSRRRTGRPSANLFCRTELRERERETERVNGGRARCRRVEAILLWRTPDGLLG